MEAAFFFLVLVCLGALLLTLRSWRRARTIQKLMEDFMAGKRPGVRAWLWSPELAGRIERFLDQAPTSSPEKFSQALGLQAVLTNMSEGVMVVDADQSIRLVNDSFRKMFELERDPAGLSVLSALREAEVENLVRALFASGETQSRELTVRSARDIAVQHLAVNAVPQTDDTGRINGAVFVFHDITQLRQLEMVRREFVSNVSHELRTPLSIFHGYLENLIDDPEMPEEERNEFYAIMQKHSLRLNALLEDLLSLARLEERHIQFKISEIDLREFIEEFAVDWQIRLGSHEIDLLLRLPDELPPLRADSLRLGQVLNNLLANAEKFTPSGGLVTIRAEALEHGQIELVVEDDGQGIPSHDLPHIFERFYRVEKARSRESGGTGLGLSIVKHIVALHGGQVKARSQLGQGTAISVILPLAGPADRAED